jgi:hypothetical protein
MTAARSGQPLFLWGLLLFACFCVFGLLLGRDAVAAPAPPRLALLVGVGEYPQTGRRPWRKLQTREEIQALRKILINRHGFLDQDVRILEDGQASGRAIREAFSQHLIARAQRGAVIFFHFSGHGQQLADHDGDELDGLDESIVPGDATEQRAEEAEKSNILDDEIAGWLRRLSQRMRGASGQVEGSIVLSFDSCFSGTLSRGDLAERGRGWDESIDGPRPQPLGGAARSGGTSTLDLDPMDYVLLSAARSDQTAKEYAGGVFSLALISALTRLPHGVSYRALLHELTIEVRRRVSNQIPDFEGNLDRTLFGAPKGGPAAPCLSVSEVTGDTFKLPIGTLHLVSPGSIYGLYRAGDEEPGPGTLLGEAEVVEATATWSRLRLRRSERGALPPEEVRRARVIERQHAYKNTPPLRVRWEEESGGPCRSPHLRAALARIDAVRLSGPEPEPQPRSPYDVKLVAGPAALRFYRPESGTPFAEIPLGAQEESVHEAVALRLRSEWRFRRLLDLRIQSAHVRAALRLVPVDAHFNAAGLVDATQPHLSKASSSLRLSEGSIYQLEVQNLSMAPVWVTVLELWPDGTIKPLFPKPERPGDALIAAGAQPRLISFPYVFQASPRGLFTLKIIATSERIELSPLAQQADALTPQETSVRSPKPGARTAAHPLGALLVEALSGRTVRGELRAVPYGDFSVDDALLEVTPKGVTPEGLP